MKNILLLASKNLAFLLRKNVKFILIVLLFLFPYPYVSIEDGKASLAYTLYPTYAANSTPSADIKLKLEELKKEIASKAAKLKEEVNRKLQDKAYIGTVEGKTQNSLTLATKNGAKIVSINQDTVFESNVKTKKSDYVAALGDIDETGVLTAKKIVLLPAKNSPLKTYLWGQIISISDKFITLKDKNLKNIAVSIPSQALDLKPNDFVIVTGSVNKNEIFEAGFVYVFPQKGVIKSKKQATSSAKPKPSTH